ncbi:hypothetical protein ABZ615_11405 [Streptomyces sp. NPDC007325]
MLLQRPDEPELMREAAMVLQIFGPDRDDIAANRMKRADALELG